MVQDCLELPPVPGIFEGNIKASDGPDLLELPFFYVSLHFLPCYNPPPPPPLSSTLPIALCLALRVSSLLPSFHPAARNILIMICSSAILLVNNDIYTRPSGDEGQVRVVGLKGWGRLCDRNANTKRSDVIGIQRQQTCQTGQRTTDCPRVEEIILGREVT